MRAPLIPDAAVRLRSPRRRVTRYLLAVGVFGAATALRYAVDPLIHDQIPYFIYVASVVVATWFCEVEGGILTTVVSAFGGNYFFVPPRYELIPHGEDWIAMGLFAAVALGLVWLVSRWKQSEHDLRRKADELRALHAESERLGQMKDEFLATLSHELRTPLNAILGWSHMLVERKLNAQRQHHAAKVIYRNAQAQSRLVNDVLDVSRIISGKLHLNVDAVDLSAVVSSSIDMVRPAAEAKEIHITTAFVPHAIIAGDADRLQQIAWNLLSNAVKFTPKGGNVHVRLDRKDSQIVFSVADSGIGIEPSFLPHLFERFRQADSSTTRQHGGLGLGLAVVRHMVELHGGTVTAESAGSNRGATFRVTLPVRAVAESDLQTHADAQTRSERPGRSEDAPVLRGTHVLVVDDEPDAREMLQTALENYGAEVRTAENAEEAVDLIQRWHADVLAADIGMPGEDGYSLIKRVRRLPAERGGTTPAIAVTAYAQDEDRERALSAGYQSHLPKPVAAHELAMAVGQLVNKRA